MQSNHYQITKLVIRQIRTTNYFTSEISLLESLKILIKDFQCLPAPAILNPILNPEPQSLTFWLKGSKTSEMCQQEAGFRMLEFVWMYLTPRSACEYVCLPSFDFLCCLLVCSLACSLGCFSISLC